MKSTLDLSNFENWISNELREAWRVAVRSIRFLFYVIRFDNDLLLLQQVNDTIPSCWYLKAKSSWNGAVRDDILQFSVFILETLSNERQAFGPHEFLPISSIQRDETEARSIPPCSLGWKAGQLSVRGTFSPSSSIHDRSRVI